MRRVVLKSLVCGFAAAALLSLAACQTQATASNTGAAAPAGTPVYDAWTTPPVAGATYAPSNAQVGSLQPAPQAVAQPGSRAVAWPGGGTPPPPPPPDGRYPVLGAPAAVAAAPAVQPAPAGLPAGAQGYQTVPPRTYTCGLPCADGISQWHIRGVVGIATFAGTDAAENCTYYGVDIGRTFCGCWGWDIYYRYNSGRFDRDPGPGQEFKDGGEFHHVGTKLTYESAFGSSRFYGWGGIGAGYFWTDKYIANDDGPEAFGELGVGYNLSRNWRLRAGVNVHAMDTKVTRKFPADDGKSRLLWIIAPVLEIEASF